MKNIVEEKEKEKDDKKKCLNYLRNLSPFSVGLPEVAGRLYIATCLLYFIHAKSIERRVSAHLRLNL